MQYISTRDKGSRVSAAEAIFRGIAPDGGLYLPESLPSLTLDFIEKLCNMDYIDRAKAILPLFLSDYTPQEIDESVRAAYETGFEDDQPAPLAKLVGGDCFLELWHGPTCAFKDMALQLLPGLLGTAIKKVGGGREAVILTATSGDTGKAALEGFRDVPGTRIMVFYPEQGVSPMQKRQMYTQQGGNVGVVAIDGNFDDAQNGVKAIFGDSGLSSEMERAGLTLSSANSINWGRLLPQIVYYFSAYCDLVADGQLALGDKVNFCVPTGNFGNILSAHYARAMGLPVAMLVCASNRNDVLTEVLCEGVYNRNRPFHATSSPSMDILISSNFERLLFELCGRDDAALRGLMTSLSETGEYRLDDAEREALQSGFWGGCCDDNDIFRTIKAVFDSHAYLCDPHTAVAVNVARQYREKTGDKLPMVVVSTASPYKFAHSVLEALDEADIPTDDFAIARRLCELTGIALPGPIAALEGAERRFDKTVPVSGMTDAVRDFLINSSI